MKVNYSILFNFCAFKQGGTPAHKYLWVPPSYHQLYNLHFMFQKYNMTSGQKGRKSSFSVDQLEILNNRFEANNYIGGRELNNLSNELNICENRIKNFFNNKRAQEKRNSNRQIKLRTCTVRIKKIDMSDMKTEQKVDDDPDIPAFHGFDIEDIY